MKILQLQKNISAPQQRRIGQALRSPFFNKNPKLANVWDALVQHTDKNNDEVKALIHKKLFPKKPYDDLVIRHLLSKLQKLLEEILGIIQLQEESTAIPMAYTQWLNKQGFELYHKQALEKLSITEPRSLTDYYNQYQWLQERETFANRHAVRYDNQILQQVSNAFDSYYLVHKLKMACAAYSLQTMYKQQFQIGFIQPIIAELQTNEPTEPLLLLYYLSLQSLVSDSQDQYFSRLKTELSNPTLSVDSAELMDLFILAQNFCIRKVNSGQEHYFEKLFDLLKASLDKQLIQHDAVQFPPAFKNIVSVALRLKAFDWVETFIKTHAEYLGPKHQDDYLNYNLARLHFELGNFEQAQDHLLLVQYKDLFIGLNARMLLLKVYYELDLYDLAASSIDSFKQYLNRKGVLAYHKQNYQNNLKYLTRLQNLNIYDKARKKLLHQQISVEQTLTEKKWLLKKLEALGYELKTIH